MNRICQIAFGLVFVVIGAAPAFADPLTESDYAYLSSEFSASKAEIAAINYNDDNKARLHELINDPATAKDPTARQSAIVDYLLGVLDERLRDGLAPP